jgi:hypothetical protein
MEPAYVPNAATSKLDATVWQVTKNVSGVAAIRYSEPTRRLWCFCSMIRTRNRRERHLGLILIADRLESRMGRPSSLEAQSVRPPKNVPPADSKASLRPCPCRGGRMFVIEVFARARTPRYLCNGPTPGHEDRHLMISFLRPPARKTRRLFRRFSTDHGEARTSTAAACRVAASMPQISPEHRPLHQPSYSPPPSQTGQLAARGIHSWTPWTPWPRSFPGRTFCLSWTGQVTTRAASL